MTCRKKSVQRRTKAEPMQRDEQGIHCRRCQFLWGVDTEGETHQKRSNHLAHVCESKAHPIAGNASHVEGCWSSTFFSEMGAKRVSLPRLRCAQEDWHREEHGIALLRGTGPSWRKTRKSQHLRNRAIIIHMRVNQSHMPLPAMLRTWKDVEIPPSLRT